MIPRSDKTQQIIKYHKDNPDATYEAIGKIFGCTKQWVSFVIKREGKDGNASTT